MNKTGTSLHKIENITSIEQLAVHYDLIVRHAKMLYGKDQPYEDLVQDWFVKLSNYFKKFPHKVINGGFVSNSLRNYIKDRHKAKKRLLNKMDYNVEIDDSIIDEDSLTMMDVDNVDIHNKIEDEKKYEILEQKMSELTWVERTVLEYSLIMTLTEMSKMSEIPYQNLVYQLNNAKKKLGIKKIK